MEEGLSMQLSTALLLCIIILGLTGGLAPLQALFRIRPFHAVYFAVCMLAFSSFVFAPVAQLRFSLQIVMLPISLALWAWHERPNPGAPAALLFFSLAAFFAGRTELLAGTQNGLLTGCIAGAAATMLVDTPRTALAVVCLVPLGGRPDERPLLWRYPLMPISGCPGTKTVCGMTFLSLGIV